MKLRKWVQLGLVVVLLAPLAACGSQSSKKAASSSRPKPTKVVQTPTEDTQFMMGTVVTLRVYNKSKDAVVAGAFKLLKHEAKLVTVNQKGSEIDKVNAAAGKHPVVVSKSIYPMLKAAYYYSQNSDESFDMAIGSITQLWRIGFSDARVPSKSEIATNVKLVDYTKVKLNDKKHSVYLEKKGMKLDLGGIAKGYMTDQVRTYFLNHGVSTAIIDLGGNIFVMGNSPKGTKSGNWTVGIQDPKRSRGTAIGSLPAKNKSIVTSGIYERYLKKNGKIYSHLMDPKTGAPYQNNLMGVSIISKTSTDGDGLSTATFDKGLKAGMKYINGKANKGIGAIFVTKDKKVYVSNNLKKQFTLFGDTGYKYGSVSDLK
ncbi:FAD:protein FMN transferase [Lactiplantibacillus mudanjiangensis]|uniref:FAD:protein FMN transferase n=1 Tax=Lactiplantibacillus mudanjiangensis TaxID=1296538 RepID=A0A660E258_9LACO|nr:FAD:protein FMN transferase [Lactiplantibacillus mudanjiangensis]VDG17665.1 thiamine biosynthesis protein ApbE [Lactobacillus sp.] [Lactiplantibacillus mudanjiangensis]VDG23058.1 thiamine biosynthesis protein ApbE [Lactobacillus sp.] [Lactiplantibacillus mudanjiangensis]VDG29531.1 thiamine biosynthesis protein ApbE [Lactobacillus sp.] [Lactiplantibacillus mudanjiangensis]VDG32645.1 thiamine biosynthesis protein ApbE [Lactobacillus sp.] [Lactiplantibacillus mudanjiangensis]